MRGYASETNVDVGRTKGEIDTMIQRAGGRDFISGVLEEKGFVMFKAKGRMIRFTIPIPKLDEFRRNGRGARRTDSQTIKAHEQEVRVRWRRLLLIIKAKLESSTSGIETFEEAFLAQTVLPDNSTVGQWAAEAIPHALQHRVVPTLALGPAKESGAT